MAKLLHLELELDATEPIAGTLSSAGGGERPFTGWLDLLAALEAACTVARAEEAVGNGPEQSDRWSGSG